MVRDKKINALNSVNPSPLKFYKQLGFVGTLREAQKLLFRNGKLLVILTFILLVMNISSIKQSITDFSLEVKASFLTVRFPTVPELADFITTSKNDLQLVAELEGIFLLAFSFTSLLFFLTTSILASGVIYYGTYLSVKEVLLRLVKSLKMPFLTWLSIMLLHLGYCLFLVAFLLPLVLLLSPNKFTLSYCSLFVLLEALLFQTYLDVVSNLALVASTLEEKLGVTVLGKTGQLIFKESKLCRFFPNVLFGAFSVAVVYGLRKIGVTAFIGSEIMIPLLLLNSMSLMRISSQMAYSPILECEETNGEELEIHIRVDCTEVTAQAG